MRFSAHGFLILDRINKMTSEKSNDANSDNSVHSVERPSPNSKKVYVSGTLHKGISVPFREITLASTKSLNGEIGGSAGVPPVSIPNEPVRVYDTSGPWGDPDFHGDVTQGLPPLRAKWILDRGDVEEINGRKVQPIDDGYLSEKHAASAAERKRPTSNAQRPTSKSKSGNGAHDRSGLIVRRSAFDVCRKILRSKSHPVTQLYYARCAKISDRKCGMQNAECGKMDAKRLHQTSNIKPQTSRAMTSHINTTETHSAQTFLMK